MFKNTKSELRNSWVQKLFDKTRHEQEAVCFKQYITHRYAQHTVSNGCIYGSLFSVQEQQLNSKANKLTDIGAPDLQTVQLGLRQNGLRDKCADPIVSAHFNGQMTLLNSYQETPDTRTFRLAFPDRRNVSFLPGQYVTLTVAIDGKAYTRSYSIASSPLRQGLIELTIKRDPNGGIVSNWLQDQLKIGGSLTIKGPYGRFTCAKNSPGKILFLAVGSGVVPIMSMLRWLCDSEAGNDIVLLLSFRTWDDIIYRDELNLIETHHPNVRIYITLTKETRPHLKNSGLSGRMTEAMIAKTVPDLPERHVYLCGPDSYMADCKRYLQNLNLPDSQLCYESFSVNATSSSDSALAMTPVSANAITSKQSVNCQIRFQRSGRTVNADSGKTLLDIADQAGVKIERECRAGSCGECMVKCLEGKVKMTELAEIDDIDRNKGWVYACCAYPESDMVLDI